MEYYALILLSVVMFGGCFALNDVFRRMCGSSLRISLYYTFFSTLAGLAVLLAVNQFRVEFTPFTLLMAALESAWGVLNALEICKSSERLIGIALSGGDYTKDLQTRITFTGVELNGARQHMIIAARAAGVQCFDTVFTNLDDMEAFERETEMIHLMGFDGKSLVNPRQIPVVHKIFTPTQKEIIFAEKVVEEIDSKKALGIGVFTVDGKMIDIAFYDGAKRTLMLAKAAGVYKGDLV